MFYHCFLNIHLAALRPNLGHFQITHPILITVWGWSFNLYFHQAARLCPWAHQSVQWDLSPQRTELFSTIFGTVLKKQLI